MHLYRSDLGGMTDNPATASSYVPTEATVPVYLPRTGNHVYNGAAWVNEGLLLESEPRTNIVTYSEDFTNAAWTKANTATLALDVVGPDGQSNSAVTLVDSGAGGTGYVRVQRTLTTVVGTVYTHSVFAKADGLTILQLATGTNNVQTNLEPAVNFNLSDGTFTKIRSPDNIAATMEDVGGGWFRCSVTYAAGYTSFSPIIGVMNTETSARFASVDLDGTSSILIFGAQFEAGSTPSSYIPTNAGATVTRAAETLTVAAADMPWPTWGDPIGPELVTNGDFANGLTDYIEGNTGTGSVSVSGGVLTLLGDSNSDRAVVYQRITATAGDLVAITVDIAAVTSGSLGIGLDSNTVFGSVLWDIVGVSTVGSVTKIIRTPYDNPYVVLFTHDGSADIDVNNISVKEINPLSVSIQMDGRMTYADNNIGNSPHGASGEVVFSRWYGGTSKFIVQSVLTNGGTGSAYFNQKLNGPDNVQAVDYFSPSVNVPFNIASRHGSTFINGAVDGTALTANTTPVGLPDLSATDFNIGPKFMGNLGGLRVWAVDLTDTGIAEATLPSTEPSLSLTFDGSETSFTVLDWSE
jgi:hypothetical protein